MALAEIPKNSAHKEFVIVFILLSLSCDGICFVYMKVSGNTKTTTNLKNAATETMVCTQTLVMVATKD